MIEIYREVYPLHDDVVVSHDVVVRDGDTVVRHDAVAVRHEVTAINLDEVFPLEVEDELRWQERALCAQTDPEAFFPEKGGSTREAKRICTTCAVRNECLEYALGNDERFGIWGGLSERERRRLKRRVS